MTYHRATEIERATGGVLDDETRTGMRYMRRFVWAILLLVTGFSLLVVLMIEWAKRAQGGP